MGNVGIMADSHGQPETIAAAIHFLRERKCHRIYHLGDICDSSRPETADACVHLLQEDGVRAVKGNNDHAIVANQRGRNRTSISQTTYDYLWGLPSIVEYKGAFFTHSRPFVRKLGLSSMIGEMSKNEAGRFFKESPRGILFRGHGHSPAIMWRDDHHIVSKILTQGQDVDLSEMIPCVVTCGALTDGLCMVWQLESQQLTCLYFRTPME